MSDVLDHPTIPQSVVVFAASPTGRSRCTFRRAPIILLRRFPVQITRTQHGLAQACARPRLVVRDDAAVLDVLFERLADPASAKFSSLGEYRKR